MIPTKMYKTSNKLYFLAGCADQGTYKMRSVAMPDKQCYDCQPGTYFKVKFGTIDGRTTVITVSRAPSSR